MKTGILLVNKHVGKCSTLLAVEEIHSNNVGASYTHYIRGILEIIQYHNTGKTSPLTYYKQVLPLGNI